MQKKPGCTVVRRRGLPSPAGKTRIVSVNDQDGTRRALGDIRADRAEQHPAGEVQPATAEDDQIEWFVLCRLDDDITGVARRNPACACDALLVQERLYLPEPSFGARTGVRIDLDRVAHFIERRPLEGGHHNYFQRFGGPPGKTVNRFPGLHRAVIGEKNFLHDPF